MASKRRDRRFSYIKRLQAKSRATVRVANAVRDLAEGEVMRFNAVHNLKGRDITLLRGGPIMTWDSRGVHQVRSAEKG